MDVGLPCTELIGGGAILKVSATAHTRYENKRENLFPHTTPMRLDTGIGCAASAADPYQRDKKPLF